MGRVKKQKLMTNDEPDGMKDKEQEVESEEQEQLSDGPEHNEKRESGNYSDDQDKEARLDKSWKKTRHTRRSLAKAKTHETINT